MVPAALYEQMSYVETYLVATWNLIAEMGPYLLLGFAVAGLLHRLIRQRWIEEKLGSRGFRSITLASIFGVPMPLCSCGVIPVTASLRNKGASKGASASFLASTPQTGIDSILATWGILGPVFALYRVVVAFLSGILVGTAIEAFTEREPKTERPSKSGKSDEKPDWANCFRYGFVTLPADIAVSLTIGFLLAGLISALAPDSLLANLPGGILVSILLTTLIATPFYICSTGSIPLALALIDKGLPVASALVLLIAGPATNVATIVTMRHILGKRETAIYLSCIVFISWIAAYAFHLLFANNVSVLDLHVHVDALSWWKHSSGVLLLLILGYGYLSGKKQGSLPADKPAVKTPEEAHLTVSGMTCSHCRQSVLDGLNGIDGAQAAEVNLDSGKATVWGEGLDPSTIKEKVEGLGFSVSEVSLRKS